MAASERDPTVAQAETTRLRQAIFHGQALLNERDASPPKRLPIPWSELHGRETTLRNEPVTLLRNGLDEYTMYSDSELLASLRSGQLQLRTRNVLGEPPVAPLPSRGGHMTLSFESPLPPPRAHSLLSKAPRSLTHSRKMTPRGAIASGSLHAHSADEAMHAHRSGGRGGEAGSSCALQLWYNVEDLFDSGRLSALHEATRHSHLAASNGRRGDLDDSPTEARGEGRVAPGGPLDGFGQVSETSAIGEHARSPLARARGGVSRSGGGGCGFDEPSEFLERSYGSALAHSSYGGMAPAGTSAFDSGMFHGGYGDGSVRMHQSGRLAAVYSSRLPRTPRSPRSPRSPRTPRSMGTGTREGVGALPPLAVGLDLQGDGAASRGRAASGGGVTSHGGAASPDAIASQAASHAASQSTTARAPEEYGEGDEAAVAVSSTSGRLASAVVTPYRLLQQTVQHDSQYAVLAAEHAATCEATREAVAAHAALLMSLRAYAASVARARRALPDVRTPRVKTVSGHTAALGGLVHATQVERLASRIAELRLACLRVVEAVDVQRTAAKAKAKWALQLAVNVSPRPTGLTATEGLASTLTATMTAANKGRMLRQVRRSMASGHTGGG